MAKIGRNQPCPCGSNKKFKRCCGNPLIQQRTSAFMTLNVATLLKEHQAKEQNRVQQQGYGKPIISAHLKGTRFVVVGNTLQASKSWTYFPDFLCDFIKDKLDRDWGNREINKPFEERHPLMQWYHQWCGFQAKQAKDESGHYKAEPNGLTYCYLGVAYNLYLLEHNAELQARFIERLKHSGQFQGAYYELIIASCLIRAGFELTLEDETDQTQKHCEFAAQSKTTGKKYWVEAKMRGVSGVLGKTDSDGQRPTSKPTSQLSRHLSEALDKPAEDERIIFIDVNTAPMTPEDFAGEEPRAPTWMEAAERQLASRERNLKDGERAYVFVTNFCFHNTLEDTFHGQAVLKFGLGMDDFGKLRQYTLKEAWRVKQKYIDLFALEEAMRSYPQIPNQFDGDLPPITPGDHERIKIGAKYNFEDIGIVGEVTTATVVEGEKKIYVSVTDSDGKSYILSEDISDTELEVYRTYPDTYFGVVQPTSQSTDDPYEFFEFLLDTYLQSTKEQLLEFMRDSPEFEILKTLDQEELALEFCERVTHTAMQDVE